MPTALDDGSQHCDGVTSASPPGSFAGQGPRAENEFSATPCHPTDLKAIRSLVLDGLASPNSRRAYANGIDAFFTWWAEVGAPALNKSTVQAFQAALQGRCLSSSTIGVYLASVRRLAASATENGLLMPEIADSISRVPGVRSQSVRPGDWLTADEIGILLQLPDCSTLKGCRDRAVLGLLVGCALRRGELTRLAVNSFETREGRWVLPDLTGKGKRLRTVPVPGWVKHFVDSWRLKAGITEGRVFRQVNKGGVLYDEGISEDTVWAVTRGYGVLMGKPKLSPHDLRRTCAKLCRASGGSLEQIQLLLGHASIQTTERYFGTHQDVARAVNDALPIPLSDTIFGVARKGPQRATANRVGVAVPSPRPAPFVEGLRGRK